MPIEKCCEDDLGAIVLLEKDVMPSPWTQEDFEYELFHNPFAHLFVFKKGKEVIGYIDVWIMYEQAQIASIAIAKPYQSQGYGAKLLQYALDRMNDDVETISLEVRKSNHKAIALYQKYGFLVQAVRPDYYQDNHEDAYLMTKRREKE